MFFIQGLQGSVETCMVTHRSDQFDVFTVVIATSKVIIPGRAADCM